MVTPPRISTVVINTTDVDQLATFWSALLEVAVQEHDPTADMIWLEPAIEGGIKLAFQQVAEHSGHTQTHLDIEVDDLDASHIKLESLGGSLVKANKLASGFEWRVCADPHGNEFCIFPTH